MMMCASNWSAKSRCTTSWIKGSEAHRVQPTVEYLGGRCCQILSVLGRFAPEDRDILARVNDVGGVGNEPLLNLTGVNF